MKSITMPNIFGCDTETYSEPSYGLKSIQIWGHSENVYITADSFDESDDDIRNTICHRFCVWLESLNNDTVLAWFNLAFDMSQIIRYIICYSAYAYTPEKADKKKWGTVSVLETPTKAYSMEIMTHAGYRVTFIDIANFLTATDLNTACHEWIGESKVEISTKRFPKSPSTPKEIEYAMHDAEITCKLAEKLMDEQVMEGTQYVTIAGRTMGHFKDYLRQQWGLKFDEWAFGKEWTKEEITEFKQVIEQKVRPSSRGGYCHMFRSGIIERCHHVDARSMYPSVMVSPFIPFGPMLEHEPPVANIKVHFPVGSFVLKPSKVPYFQFRSKVQCARYENTHPLNPGEMCDSVYLDGSYMLWDDELNLILDLYDCKIESDTVNYFQAKENTVLKEYVEMLYRGKMENTGTRRYYYKILLNSLYGKFLSRPDGEYVDYTNGERHTLVNDDRTLYYLPLGSFIAMGGRVRLCRAMSSIPYENLIYCDTDSIVFTGDIWPNITIGKYLNQWGIENDNFRFNGIGPKTYQEVAYDGSNLITKCAGLNRKVIETIGFGELKEGVTYTTLKSQRNPETWAINLIPTTHEVKCRTDVFGRFFR